jgi:hypothetical protein
MCATCFREHKGVIPSSHREAAEEPVKEPLLFEWTQNSLKFAVSDFRRNWKRWLFWASLFLGAEAALIEFLPSDPRHHAADPRLFYPCIFAGAFLVQFVIALCMWPVRVSERQTVLGYPGSRGSRVYRFGRISSVRFSLMEAPGSMLVALRSGKKIEIFFDDEGVMIPKLRRYFESGGIPVSDARPD